MTTDIFDLIDNISPLTRAKFGSGIRAMVLPQNCHGCKWLDEIYTLDGVKNIDCKAPDIVRWSSAHGHITAATKSGPSTTRGASYMHQVILKTDFIRQIMRAAMTEYNAKIQEIEDRLTAVEEELRALKAEKGKDDLPTPPHQRPYPECSQNYFYVNAVGEVEESQWMADRFDRLAHEIGNVFLTVDDAKFAAERRKVLGEMREWAGNWDDEFTLRYDENSGIETYIHVFPSKSYGEMRFATKEDAVNCINAVGKERIKKYYFMIPEEKA